MRLSPLLPLGGRGVNRELEAGPALTHDNQQLYHSSILMKIYKPHLFIKGALSKNHLAFLTIGRTSNKRQTKRLCLCYTNCCHLWHSRSMILTHKHSHLDCFERWHLNQSYSTNVKTHNKNVTLIKFFSPVTDTHIVFWPLILQWTIHIQIPPYCWQFTTANILFWSITNTGTLFSRYIEVKSVYPIITLLTLLKKETNSSTLKDLNFTNQ